MVSHSKERISKVSTYKIHTVSPVTQIIKKVDAVGISFLISIPGITKFEKRKFLSKSAYGYAKKYLINPLLVHIKSMLLSHRKSLLENLEQENAEVCEKIANNMKNIAEMIKNIDDGVLSEGILKYISPHLYMDNKLQIK